MRRILLISALLTAAIAARAQVEVAPNGHLMVGKQQVIDPNPIVTPDVPQLIGSEGSVIGGGLDYYKKVPVDTAATMLVLGKGEYNAGGYISFGSYAAAIGQTFRSNAYNTLELYGQNGIRGYGSDGMIFLGSGNLSAPFRFYTDVQAKGVLLTSDARLKHDVEGIEGLSSSLAALNPVSFKYNGASADAAQAKKASAESAQTDERTRYGFIAQEVKEIFPDLVVEDGDGYLSIDYIGFIPMLVSAVKDLRAEVEELRNPAAEAPVHAPGNAGIEEAAVVKPSLSQNKPNPFSAATRIGCTLPESVADASLCVYDLQGKQVLRLKVEGRGATSVNIDGSGLQPGMYIYALIADGVEIDTKRMILTD